MEKKYLHLLKIAAVILLVILSGRHTPLSALDPALHIDQYNLEIYTTESGLPQSSVLSIVQTADGYIWLATYEGMARFDGIRFRLFNTINTPEMASNRIRVLLEDNSGDLWIGTNGGLLRYRSGVFKNYTLHDGLSSDRVSSLYIDRAGNLWVGTTNGLNRLEQDSTGSGGTVFTHYKEEPGLANAYISALTEDRHGALWIGTSGNGVYFYTSGKFTRCGGEKIPNQADIRTLYKDPGGGIWAGIRGRGLVYAEDGSKGRFREYLTRDGLSGSDVRAVFRDSVGTLWIGTNGQGLNTFKNGRFAYSISEQGFFNSPIRAFLEDREGSLWVGTRDGLSQLKEGKFILYSNRNGLPVDSIRTVFQDRGGSIWLGTVGGGLARYDDDGFKVFNSEQGFKSDHIWTIAQSSCGDLWVGTYGGGLHRFRNNRVIRVYTTANGLSNNVIRAVYVDPQDNVWVGTNGGGVDVIRLKTGSPNPIITNYSTKNGLSDDFVYAISGDRDGNTWIGTYYGNLNRFRDGRFTVYGTKDGLTVDAIWSIYPGDGGRLWLGTDGGGLIRFHNGTVTRFTAKDGLYSDLAFQVLDDRRGNLWMNCNRGIYSVNKKELEDYAAGKVKRINCLSFGKKEGIKNTECNGPAQPAGICTPGGTLWFPTIRGAVVMTPQKQKINKVIPPVVIEEMRADGRLIHDYPERGSGEEGYRLSPGKKRLEFTFTGLSFTAPQQVKFKYRLEGFDDNWLEAGTRRQVTYTNIEPGQYKFRVIAANNDGVWNTTGAVLDFTMDAFFWQTRWFRAILVVLFAFFSYAGIGFIRNHMKLIAFWKKKKYIGSYEIEKQIGVGGMGIVYKVHSLMDKRLRFAMKVMKEEHLLDEVQKKRFKNESLLVDSIDHPHIVKIHERGESTGVLYIVMELLEGSTLAQRYKEEQYFTPDQCVHITRQVAHILVTLHREDIIHRDLKPENIMLIHRNDDPNYVKLLDFGIARVQSFSRLTETGQVLGTIPYMPPEVLAGGVNSASVDVYSLGIIAYEMLTRKLPFTGDKPLDTMRKILKEEPEPPIKLNPDVPLWLNDLVLQMIGKNAEERPNAREVLARLARSFAHPGNPQA